MYDSIIKISLTIKSNHRHKRKEDTIMITELKQSEFDIIKNLLNEEADNVEVKSIIEGINPGWVFVDSKDKPNVALVWSQGQEGFYFVGSENISTFNLALNDYIDEMIEERGIRAGLNRFEFSGDSEKWDPVFKEIFKNRQLTISTQYIYKLTQTDWDQDKRDNETNYILHRIDRALLSNEKYKNINFLTEEILRWWHSIDDFIEKSFGYCMVDGDTIANYSMGNFFIDQVMTIGIETLEKYRRLGLSQITTEAFIQECFNNNYSIQWECMGENTASYLLAEKLNFTRTCEYTLYSFPFRASKSTRI